MDFTAIIAQLIGGAAGGTASGRAVPSTDLGQIGNLIAGAVGGLGGGSILTAILGTGGAAAGGLDIASLAASLIGGGAGGAVLQLVAGFIKSKLA